MHEISIKHNTDRKGAWISTTLRVFFFSEFNLLVNRAIMSQAFFKQLNFGWILKILVSCGNVLLQIIRFVHLKKVHKNNFLHFHSFGQKKRKKNEWTFVYTSAFTSKSGNHFCRMNFIQIFDFNLCYAAFGFAFFCRHLCYA